MTLFSHLSIAAIALSVMSAHSAIAYTYNSEPKATAYGDKPTDPYYAPPPSTNIPGVNPEDDRLIDTNTKERNRLGGVATRPDDTLIM